jgi:hypothetical protein
MEMQNSEFGIQSESETGRWIGSALPRNKKGSNVKAQRLDCHDFW